MELEKFVDLPLGTRFSYQGSEVIWVVLERYGLGKVAKWEGVIIGFHGQSICCVDETEEKVKALEVVVVEIPGNCKISMGENVGWITGPYDAVKAVQKLIIDGEEYRKDIHDIGAGLKALAVEYANLVKENDETRNQLEQANEAFLKDFNTVTDLRAENKKLESKREYDIEVMRTAQGLLKDGAQGTIVDTVWVSDESNATLWELLEMAIDGD